MTYTLASAAGGPPTFDTLVVWSLGAVAIITALGLLWRFVRGIHRFTERFEDFTEDWNGVPARPGVPARKGVMERLDGIEDRLGSVETELRSQHNAPVPSVSHVDISLNGQRPV